MPPALAKKMFKESPSVVKELRKRGRHPPVSAAGDEQNRRLHAMNGGLDVSVIRVKMHSIAGDRNNEIGNRESREPKDQSEMVVHGLSKRQERAVGNNRREPL